MNRFGFLRVAVCSPRVTVAAPARNVAATIAMLDSVRDADIVVFPELGITGYTCGDLFRQSTLLDAAKAGLLELAASTAAHAGLIFVGLPVAVGPHLFNCAAALHRGAVLGVVPKTHLPNYSEFYEARWFRAGRGELPATISLGGLDVPFGTDLLFEGGGCVVFAEICEDLWVPIPPSSFAAVAGANVLVNLSASNETVGKHEYRTELVRNQSGRCVAAYAYASAGPGESSTDLVFGGHSLICENGSLLAESRRVGDGRGPVSKEAGTSQGWFVVADADLERIAAERRLLTSFDGGDRAAHPHPWRRVAWTPEWSNRRCLDGTSPDSRLFRRTNRSCRLDAPRCSVFNAQRYGNGWRRLASGNGDRRLGRFGLDLGAAGGDASPRRSGTGTERHSRNHAAWIWHNTENAGERDPIDGSVGNSPTNHRHPRRVPANVPRSGDAPVRYRSIGSRRTTSHRGTIHRGLGAIDSRGPREGGFGLRNVQARERTKLLMNRGFVIGTGDLSEAALGWCTYNADI